MKRSNVFGSLDGVSDARYRDDDQASDSSSPVHSSGHGEDAPSYGQYNNHSYPYNNKNSSLYRDARSSPEIGNSNNAWGAELSAGRYNTSGQQPSLKGWGGYDSKPPVAPKPRVAPKLTYYVPPQTITQPPEDEVEPPVPQRPSHYVQSSISHSLDGQSPAQPSPTIQPSPTSQPRIQIQSPYNSGLNDEESRLVEPRTRIAGSQPNLLTSQPKPTASQTIEPRSQHSLLGSQPNLPQSQPNESRPIYPNSTTLPKSFLSQEKAPLPGTHIPAISFGTLPRQRKVDQNEYTYHTVTILKDQGQGLGLALAGGRDNPQLRTGDTSVLISDVVPHSPSYGLLKMNDRIVSVNGSPTLNMLHKEAVNLLKNAGTTIVIELARPKPVTAKPQSNSITLSKFGQESGFGVELCVKYYVNKIIPDSPASRDGRICVNEAISKINGIDLDEIPFLEARKMLLSSPANHVELTLANSQSASPSMSNPETDGGEIIKPVNGTLLKATSESAFTQASTPDFTQLSYNSQDDEGGFQVYRSTGVGTLPSKSYSLEARTIRLMGGSGLGLKVIGGNLTGVFVSQTQEGSQASNQGLVPGDEILKVGIVKHALLHSL